MSDVVVDDKGLSVILELLSQDFPALAQEALEDAFVNGGVLEDVWKATPKSERAKYAERIDPDLVRYRTGVDGRDSASLARGWRKRVTPEQAEKLDEYGQTRLASSLLPSLSGLDQLGFRTTSSGVEFSISSSVPYAGRMHETSVPAKGDYWAPGKRGGWSTAGTGAKYIEDVVDVARVTEALSDCLSKGARI